MMKIVNKVMNCVNSFAFILLRFVNLNKYNSVFIDNKCFLTVLKGLNYSSCKNESSYPKSYSSLSNSRK